MSGQNSRIPAIPPHFLNILGEPRLTASIDRQEHGGWAYLKNTTTRKETKGYIEALSRLFSENANTILIASFGFFFFLYYLDLLTTILLLALFPNTFERNLLFAPLLSGGFSEVAAAVTLKLLLVSPLVAVIAWPPTRVESRIGLKALKLGAFAGIIALIPLTMWVALGNNLFSLVKLASLVRAG